MKKIQLADVINLKSIQNIASAISHSLNLLLSFVLTPILLNEIGLKYFGIYSILLSIITILGVFDLGISNSQIRDIQIKTNTETVEEVFSNAIAVLIFGSCTVFTIGFIFYYFETMNIPRLGNEITLSNTKNIILICTFTAASMLFGNFANRVRLARSRTFTLSFWTVAPNLTWLITLVTLKLLNANPIKILEFCLLVPGLIALFNFLHLILREEPKLFNVKSISLYVIKKLLAKSRIFIYLQISMIFSFQMDNLIAAKYLTLEQVGILALSVKMISVPISIIAAASLPIWAQMASVSEESDVRKSLSTVFTLMRRILIAIIPVASLLVLFLPSLLNAWTRKEIGINRIDSLVLVIWLVVAIISQPISMAINGLELRRLMKIGAIAGTFFNFLISVFLCSNYGLTFGTVIGSIVGLMLFTILPFIQFARRSVLIKSELSESC